MKNNFQKVQDEEIKTIENEMKNLSKIWCLEEIKGIDIEKIIKDCYQQLFQSEDLKEFIKKRIQNLIKKLIKEKEIRHLNIIIIGKTGVGKSTLINEIFREKLALSRKGEPCTMETTPYTNEKYNFLKIYDTRGIEISKNFDINKVLKETLGNIKEKCEKNEPNDLIHCLIYCFTGSRFEKEEGELLIKLRKTYEKKTLPIIIVLTQDFGEENEDDEEEKYNLYDSIDNILEVKCGEHLSEKPKDISFIKILAKEKKISKSIIIPSKGLDVLLKHCLEKGEYSSKFAVLSSIIYSGEKEIKNELLEKKKNIILEGKIFYDELFLNYKEEKNFKIIFEKFIEKNIHEFFPQNRTSK